MPRRPAAVPRAPIGRREIRRRQVNVRLSLGRQLGELREELGVSQAAAAAGAGIGPGHVSRIERGLVAASLDTLVALAAALGADVSVRLFPTSGPRIRDRLQAPIVEALLHR